jgi:hypothetical protein
VSIKVAIVARNCSKFEQLLKAEESLNIFISDLFTDNGIAEIYGTL